jgi:hypothetical protein
MPESIPSHAPQIDKIPPIYLSFKVTDCFEIFIDFEMSFSKSA